MNFLIACVWAFSLATALAFNTPKAEINSNAINFEIDYRITNGTTAKEAQFPYQVGLLLTANGKVFYWCGGTLIHKKWVLTAAHCTYPALFAYVYLGSTKRTIAEVTHIVYKRNFINHILYNRYSGQNDIALIRIPPTTLNSKIKTIRLPAVFKPYETYANRYAIATGWGKTADNATTTVVDNLQWARLKVISNKECSQKLKYIKKSNLCVATVNGTAPCKGDSGGPLVLESKGILIGITSFDAGYGCQNGYPVAFTRITSYLYWIQFYTGVIYN